MNDFTTALERELERLDGELLRDPRYRRIKQIRDLLAEYKTPDPAQAVPIGPANRFPNNSLFSTAAVVANPSPGRVRMMPLSKANSIKQAVTTLLRDRGSVHRAEILKYLIDNQLMGHEKTPMASLAAYLSDWKDLFQTDGHGNFSLRSSTTGTTNTAPVSR